MPDKFTGRCACGALTYEFSTAPEFIANCHCKDCRVASGAVVSTYFSVAADDFRLLSGNPRPYPYIAATGNTLERNFCPDCGARVFTDKLSGFPGQVFVEVGSLDDPEAIAPPIMEIFTKYRISWTKPLDVPQYPGRPDGKELSPSERQKLGAGEGCG
jgi:hypothetical protein